MRARARMDQKKEERRQTNATPTSRIQTAPRAGSLSDRRSLTRENKKGSGVLSTPFVSRHSAVACGGGEQLSGGWRGSRGRGEGSPVGNESCQLCYSGYSQEIVVFVKGITQMNISLTQELERLFDKKLKSSRELLPR